MKIVCKDTNNNLSKQIFLLFLPKHQCSQTTSPIFGSNTVLGAIFVASVSAFFRGSSQEWRARAYLALCTVKIRSAFKSGTSYYDFAYVNVEQQAVGVKLQIVTRWFIQIRQTTCFILTPVKILKPEPITALKLSIRWDKRCLKLLSTTNSCQWT